MGKRLQPHYRSLDLWRGVACLTVVIYHAARLVADSRQGSTAAIHAVLRYGYLGVPLFFVISGYCIAAACDAHRRSNQPAWKFIWRRARRIYPPFWAATVLLVASVMANEAFGLNAMYLRYEMLRDLSPLHWLSNLTLSDTWMRHVLGPWPHINSSTWSLCYEEQFYFICFVILLLARSRFFAAILWFSIAVTTVWFCVSIFGSSSHLSGIFVDFGWWLFICGVGVYWRLNYVTDAALARRIDRVVWPTASCLVLCLLVVASRYHEGNSYFVNPWLGLLVAIAFSMALMRLRAFDHRMVNSRIGSTLAGVGRYSYSLYLIHGPVCVLVHALMFRLGFWTPARALLGTIPVSVLASMLIAWVFHRLVERRFLNPSVATSRRVGDEDRDKSASLALPPAKNLLKDSAECTLPSHCHTAGCGC